MKAIQRVGDFIRNVRRLNELLYAESENNRLKKRNEKLSSQQYEIIVASAAYVLKLNSAHKEELSKKDSEIQMLRAENLCLREAAGLSAPPCRKEAV